ncbi:hypothetical protein E2C01_069748 [Portunus trituberculatus]|uniref:Uncharacterized protein n=1 Tax=Portunus trituberculatus TaxID=210409 RepID=A0A5B7HVE1_PORTR|nr:hypothetical protein [Portunus trituberculatus]
MSGERRQWLAPIRPDLLKDDNVKRLEPTDYNKLGMLRLSSETHIYSFF